MKTFISTLKRAFTSKMFLIALVMTFFFRLLDLFPVIMQGSMIVDGKLSFMYNIGDLPELYGITMFGLIMLIVPVLPYSSAYCDDYSSQYLTYALVKTSKSKYSCSTVISCALSAFFCTILGEILALLALSPFTSFYTASYDTFNHALLVVSTRIILLGLRGAFYAVVTMLLSVFTNSKFIIYTTPLLLYFFFMYFGSYILKISTKINPAHIYRYYIFGEGEEIKSVLYAFVYLIIIMFFTIRTLEKKIERCY